MSTKVVPITDSQEEHEAAAKMQAIQRGKLARKESKYIPGQVEQRMMSGKNLLGDAGGQKKSWKLVRAQTGIQFNNWEMALKVVDKTFQGELAREVQRRVKESQANPYAPYGMAFIIFILYLALFFCFRGDMAFPEDPIMAKGFAVTIIWVLSTLGGKAMGKIGMPGLLGNLLSGVLLKNLIPYPGGTYDYDSAECPPPPGCAASGSGSGSISGRMLAGGGIDYSSPQWCIGKSLNGLPDDWASDIITFGLSIIFMCVGRARSPHAHPLSRPLSPPAAPPPKLMCSALMCSALMRSALMCSALMCSAIESLRSGSRLLPTRASPPSFALLRAGAAASSWISTSSRRPAWARCVSPSCPESSRPSWSPSSPRSSSVRERGRSPSLLAARQNLPRP